jgi:hypothetical protein
MTDLVDCPALHARYTAKGYPFGDRVPKTVRLRCMVSSDLFMGDWLIARAMQEYPAWTNSYGAVSAVFPDGKKLGIKPDEFKIVAWHEKEDMPL